MCAARWRLGLTATPEVLENLVDQAPSLEPELATALYRAALPAVVHNPRLAEFYQGLRERGKTAKQALCAVAHKLIRICFALVKTQTTFSLTYAPDLP